MKRWKIRYFKRSTEISIQPKELLLLKGDVSDKQKALWESFKQLGRTLLFLVVAWLLSGTVISWILDLLFGTRLDEGAKLQITAGLTLVLQYIDKYLHENDSIKLNGLIPF